MHLTQLIRRFSLVALLALLMLPSTGCGPGAETTNATNAALAPVPDDDQLREDLDDVLDCR